MPAERKNQVYMQNDIAAAATSKGPHFNEPRIDPGERLAEVDQVIAAATAAMPKATMRKLGALSFAIAAHDDDYSYFGQIRSEPIGGSGLEFRFPVPARDTGRRDLAKVAGQLVEAAVTTARSAPKFAEQASLIREMAAQSIAPATGGITAMRIVAIGLTPSLPGAMMRLTVDVEMLGDDLTLGIDRVVGHDIDSLEEKLGKLVELHLTRRKALAAARVAGVSGWIDDAARLVLDTAGLGVGGTVPMLGLQPEVDFSFGGYEGYDVSAAIFWVDGTVKCFVEDRTRGSTFRLQQDQLTVEGANVPAEIRPGLIGRRVREVVDIPVIPRTAIIVDVRESDEWLYLDLEIGRSPLEAAGPTES